MAQIQTQGTCIYCGKSFNKRGITRHLKSCKVRQKVHQGAIASNTGTRLVHLQVWGEYNPEYWMHLEVPAALPLQDLDQFLRNIWLECCGHLSHFIIGDTYYEAVTEDMIYGQPYNIGPGDELDFDDEEAEGFIVPPLVKPGMPGALPGLPGSLPGLLSPSDLLPFDDVDDEDDDDLEAEEFSRFMLGQVMAHFAGSDQEHIDREAMLDFVMGQLAGNDILGQLTPQERAEALAALRADIEQIIPAEGIANPFQGLPPVNPFMMLDPFDMFMPPYEERDMDISLGDVVEAGLEFRHEYDYGSTTELKLKVVDIFDGADPGEDLVRIVSRNDPPLIMCERCGKKPATLVCPYCMYNAEAWFCEDCARLHNDGEGVFLPVVNSPRVGVCGYTGDSEYFYDDEAFDEDSEDDSDSLAE